MTTLALVCRDRLLDIGRSSSVETVSDLAAPKPSLQEHGEISAGFRDYLERRNDRHRKEQQHEALLQGDFGIDGMGSSGDVSLPFKFGPPRPDCCMVAEPRELGDAHMNSPVFIRSAHRICGSAATMTHVRIVLMSRVGDLVSLVSQRPTSRFAVGLAGPSLTKICARGVK